MARRKARMRINQSREPGARLVMGFWPERRQWLWLPPLYQGVEGCSNKSKNRASPDRGRNDRTGCHPGRCAPPRHCRELSQAGSGSGEGLSQDEENRPQAHNIVRGLIDRVTVTPSSRKRCGNIEVSGRLATILSLASGKPVPANMYAGDGGSGNPNIEQNYRNSANLCPENSHKAPNRAPNRSDCPRQVAVSRDQWVLWMHFRE